MPKRVLVTRAPQQASVLADQLRAQGLEPILIPTIELSPPTTFAPLDTAIANLFGPNEDRVPQGFSLGSQSPGTNQVPQGFSLGSHSLLEREGALAPAFHWLLFTSANAVEAFFLRLGETQVSRGLSLESHSPGTNQVPQGFSLGSHGLQKERLALAPGVRLPSGLKIAAIGPATARSLESFGTKVDLISPQAVAESLAQALLPHVLQPDGRPTCFLLVRAQFVEEKLARDILPDILRSAGARVTIAPAYQNTIPLESVPAIQALFATPDTYPDAITFTSSSTATHLLALLRSAHLTLPSAIPRISIGPVTSQTLRELSYPPHAEATEATVPALVRAVLLHLSNS